MEALVDEQKLVGVVIDIAPPNRLTMLPMLKVPAEHGDVHMKHLPGLSLDVACDAIFIIGIESVTQQVLVLFEETFSSCKLYVPSGMEQVYWLSHLDFAGEPLDIEWDKIFICSIYAEGAASLPFTCDDDFPQSKILCSIEARIALARAVQKSMRGSKAGQQSVKIGPVHFPRCDAYDLFAILKGGAEAYTTR